MMLRKENTYQAYAVVLDNDKILLCRKDRLGKTYWVLPGGAIEIGESVTHAVARETKEETGYDIAIEKWLYLRHANDVLSGRRLEVYVLGRATGGKLDGKSDPDGDIKEARWVPLTEMHTLDAKPAILKDVLAADFASNFVKNPRDLGFEEY